MGGIDSHFPARLRPMASLMVVFSLLLAGCADLNSTDAAAEIDHSPKPWLLELPGIAGERGVDRAVTGGVRDYGFQGEITIHDWTENDPGMNALVAYAKNKERSKIVADKIIAHFRANPDQPIYVIAHSGGTGLAVWALERLPDDVHIETICLVSSALSPTYDLSKALTHVRGKMYSFNSTYDVLVLGFGTKTFGTIDGVKIEAGGLNGFTIPPGADAKQYAKFEQHAYQPEWLRLGNFGDHIGAMSRRFSKAVVAPLMFTGKIPPLPVPATQPESFRAGKEVFPTGKS